MHKISNSFHDYPRGQITNFGRFCDSSRRQTDEIIEPKIHGIITDDIWAKKCQILSKFWYYPAGGIVIDGDWRQNGRIWSYRWEQMLLPMTDNDIKNNIYGFIGCGKRLMISLDRMFVRNNCV